jgi:hypothetical protein
MPTDTPPEPEQPKRATLRARTRTNPVRPEVIDALDELERSLGDVSRWEQLLTGKEAATEWERPGAAPAAAGDHFGPSHMAPTDSDDIDGESAVALEEAIRNLDDRIEGIRADAPMLQAPVVGPAPEGLPYQLGPAATAALQPVQASPMILQSARTVEPGSRRPVVTPEEEDEIDRRRRNGRALTWVGLALLVALGGVFFLPKSDDGDTPEAPAVTATVPTTAPFVTAPLLPTEEITTIPTLPVEDTTTTKATTASTKKTTPTTKAPVVTPGTTAPTPTSTLVTPGPSSTTTSTTQPEPVTTTSEPATTTTGSGGF